MLRFALIVAILTAPTTLALPVRACDPGTFTPAEPLVCEANQVAVPFAGVRAGEDHTGCAGCEAHVAVWIADDRGNLVPEADATVSSERDVGTFNDGRCVRVRGNLTWGPFFQGFGGPSCDATLP